MIIYYRNLKTRYRANILYPLIEFFLMRINDVDLSVVNPLVEGAM